MRTSLYAGLAGAVILGLTASPAFAQETTEDAPFNGLYVGAAGGYDVQPNDAGSSILFDRNLDGRFGDAVTTAAGANAFSSGFCNGATTATTLTGGRGCRKDKDGAAYYGRVGMDTQRGNIVVGVVGEFGKSEITDSVTAFSTTPASYVMTRSVDWEASIRGRAGYAVNTTLFYGTFGAGYAKIDRDFYSTNTGNAYQQSGKRQQFGILGGGGIEQKVTPNISVGMEYMFHQYQDDDFRVRVTQGTQPATNPFVLAPNTTGTDFRRSDDKFRWHSLRATAAFRF
ncbi:Membrane protein [Sphingomonas sp. T1]|jgi:outer membrane immunogenic protein|uniref:Outer membrane immunogenic protein n=1 Tax=Sphingomonas aerolata TaxID=185951 RepID=A0A2T4YTK5_9SPHN|nr:MULTISPECIES: outer membrane beta-barrel protein [Sphingomonas]KHA64439.1 membrane protein [Sphingomonas sp. Ant20]MBB3588268.1 outer membrane immunogenic protein [Sphingomonas sp. BK481]MBD8470742.1 porin family protein [Sphingomonas sp. CFBP 8765]MBD8734392.1 porin family protein [Sphingomonas sp. CFBP 13706]PTM47144.1 outer membrane immunogenic protein [Sphingomonas aerolata]